MPLSLTLGISAWTPEAFHQRFDAGAVDKDRQRDHHQCQVHELHRQFFRESVLYGIHKIVERTDSPYPEPAHHAADIPWRAGTGQTDQDADRTRHQEQEQREAHTPPTPGIDDT